MTDQLSNLYIKSDKIKELTQEKSILNETILLQDVIHQKTNRNFYFIICFLSVFIPPGFSYGLCPVRF